MDCKENANDPNNHITRPIRNLKITTRNYNQTEHKYKSINITTTHTITTEKDETQEYILNLNEESTGTQNLFYISPVLEETLKEGKILVIDEIDKSLHPLLVKYIVELFNNKEINKNNAQLIFNTHDTNLLSLDLFRRDQIMFTEKKYESGETELYGLDDFSVRKKEDIKKGYLLGRYGAIPFMGNGTNLWQD